jgi:hypothetical protein
MYQPEVRAGCLCALRTITSAPASLAARIGGSGGDPADRGLGPAVARLDEARADRPDP